MSRRRRRRARNSLFVPRLRDLRAVHTHFIPNCSRIPMWAADALAVASLEHLRLRASALWMRKGFGARAFFLLALALSLALGALLFSGGVSPGHTQARVGNAPFSNVVLQNGQSRARGSRGARGSRDAAGENGTGSSAGGSSAPASSSSSASSPGRIPVRRSATPGAPPGYWPAPGWDSQWDWKGWVRPVEELPHAYDPERGLRRHGQPGGDGRARRPFLTSRVGLRLPGPADPHACSPSTPKVSPAGHVADPGRRAQHVRARASSSASSPCRSTTSPPRPSGCCATGTAASRTTSRATRRRPRTTTPSGSTCSSYTFDELPPDLAPDGGSRWMVVVEQLLKDPKNDWWDDKTTPGVTEGSGRDPQAGARRGPPRPRPRARQGARDVALGPAAPARPAAPRHGRRRRCPR